MGEASRARTASQFTSDQRAELIRQLILNGNQDAFGARAIVELILKIHSRSVAGRSSGGQGTSASLLTSARNQCEASRRTIGF